MVLVRARLGLAGHLLQGVARARATADRCVVLRDGMYPFYCAECVGLGAPVRPSMGLP